MYAKKRRFTPLIVVLLLLLTVGTTGTTVAKYIHSTQLEGKVTFTAKLAENITLLEHEAKRNDDGSYYLTNDTTNGNEYTLIPGLDVPKDPYITITGKTPIKAYLFVEVYHALGNTYITYELSENWKLVEGLKGKEKSGSVYVYTGGADDALPLNDENCPTGPIYILKDNEIKVGQKLLSGQLTEQHLDFYACLSEVPTDENAVTDLITIYENAYQTQN